MPRSTRDSEEDVDPKPGRKTRLADVLSVDSSLRRSSRIKTVKQNESSPESFSSNTSNVSNTQTRVTRNRTDTMDNITTTEKQRPLRSRMNSISSNVSEDTKSDANTMTPTKRNRNSIMGDVFNKTNNRRNTRFTRAGSESKTPPMRVTRNTRASSMEPESVEENKHMDKNECEFIHTSNKMRTRASIVPSETTVVEEKEEIMKILVVALDRTLPNVSEIKEMGLNNSLKSAQKHESMSNAEGNFDSSCNVVNEKSIEDISDMSTELDEKVPKKEESANDSSPLKNKSTEKSGSDEQKSESIQETCNKNQGSEAVEETPIELNEEELKEEEYASDSSTLKNKSTEKSGSDAQKSESIQETCNKNQENDAVEDNDSGITAGNLFQNIPSAEWKEKNDDIDKNSIHSMSTERLETEMETECDLVLVDREAWLAAENIKTAKEKEASDYDSDDTVLLKMQRDSGKAQKNEKMKMNKSVDKMNDSKDTSINENDIDNEATNMKDFKDETENENQDKSITEKWNEHSTFKRNVSSWKSPERKSLNKSHKTMEAEENLSESITKKRKSLNKLTSKVDVSRKSLNKSIQKEMESESVINKSARNDKEKRSLNISSRKQRNCIEESENESKDSSIPEKKSNAKKKFSRNRSAIRTIESDSDDSKSESGDSENKTIELPKFMLDEASNIDSNESDKSMDSDIEKEYNLAGKDISKFSDDDVRGDECRASETESSDPEDNGSDLDDFIVDDVEEDEESEGEGEKINEESEEGEKTNEEIEIGELHADKDTEDFIVEEVEESEREGEGEKVNEESEEEGEKASEEIEIEESEGEEEKVNEESEEEEEKVNEEIEIEELHTDEDTEKSQEKKIKEQDEAMQVQEPDAIEDKIKGGMTEEESQNKNERENIEEDVDKLIDTSSKQKNKLEISDRLSTIQTSRKKKLKKVDISQSEKSEEENNLSDSSLSNSLKMKTTKQKKHASSEFILEDIELSLNDSQSIFNKRSQKLSKSIMKCSTPKSHYLPKSNGFDDSIKTQNTNDGKVNASSDIDKIEDTSLKTKDTFKKLGKIKSKENLVDKRFSCGLEELVEKTKFSKPLSPKIANLNKSNLVPDSDTPTTKYLKKDKLNESAPVLKLDTVFKKLVDANDNDEQNNALNQPREESENVNTPNSETLSYSVLDLDTSLKQKLLSVADNILKVDRRKKHKKRKQTAEKSNATILIEDSFLEEIESQIVNEDKNVVSTIDTDKNKKFEEVSFNEEKKKEKKKKKQKIAHIDINKDVEEEESHEEITDTTIKIAKKPKKVKKKQEKEITEDLSDICSENQVSGKKKKKKKISEALSNEEIPTTRISKKTQKLSKDIAVQNDETAVIKLPKKKKKLVSEDASSQEKILTNKLPKKKQNVSPNDTSQDKNISAEKLLKKQHKLVAEDAKSEVKPVKKSNKSQQSTDIVPDSDEGPTVVKFSEPLKEALKVTDSIKVNKEKEKKKQKKRLQERELENEKPESKKQKIKDNKAESTRGIKRLSVELLEDLSDVPSKPLKKRKLSKIKDQILPSRSMFNLKAKEVENVYVEEDFESLSSCGSTTHFAVVNMQKIKKKKKIRSVVSFKRKVIATNSRYLEKH